MICVSRERRSGTSPKPQAAGGGLRAVREKVDRGEEGPGIRPAAAGLLMLDDPGVAALLFGGFNLRAKPNDRMPPNRGRERPAPTGGARWSPRQKARAATVNRLRPHPAAQPIGGRKDQTPARPTGPHSMGETTPSTTTTRGPLPRPTIAASSATRPAKVHRPAGPGTGPKRQARSTSELGKGNAPMTGAPPPANPIHAAGERSDPPASCRRGR